MVVPRQIIQIKPFFSIENHGDLTIPYFKPQVSAPCQCQIRRAVCSSILSGSL